MPEVTPDERRYARLAQALQETGQVADAAVDDLLRLVPDLGDHQTGRAVDAFVEVAGDALRALAVSSGSSATAARAASGAPGLGDVPRGRAVGHTGWGWQG